MMRGRSRLGGGIAAMWPGRLGHGEPSTPRHSRWSLETGWRLVGAMFIVGWVSLALLVLWQFGRFDASLQDGAVVVEVLSDTLEMRRHEKLFYLDGRPEDLAAARAAALRALDRVQAPEGARWFTPKERQRFAADMDVYLTGLARVGRWERSALSAHAAALASEIETVRGAGSALSAAAKAAVARERDALRSQLHDAGVRLWGGFLLLLGLALVVWFAVRGVVIEPLRRVTEAVSVLDPTRPGALEVTGPVMREFDALLGAIRGLMQRLQAAEQTRAKAERLEALGLLTAGLMHEINNPLGNARVALALRRERLEHDATVHRPRREPLPDPASRCPTETRTRQAQDGVRGARWSTEAMRREECRVERAQREIERALGLVRTLVTYNQGVAVTGGPRAWDTDDLVADVLACLEPEARARVRVLHGRGVGPASRPRARADDAVARGGFVDGPRGPATCGRVDRPWRWWANGEALRQVLLNLIDNALAHAPQGEAVVVTFDPAPDGSDRGAGVSLTLAEAVAAAHEYGLWRFAKWPPDQPSIGGGAWAMRGASVAVGDASTATLACLDGHGSAREGRPPRAPRPRVTTPSGPIRPAALRDGRACDGGAQPGWGYIGVENPGAPIEPKVFDHLFEPFRRGEQTGRVGSGLGLYLAASLVNAEGGYIAAERRADGARFAVWLPVVRTST